jgi:hypothetical protein
MDTESASRRSILTGMGFAAAGLALGTSLDADAQEEMPAFQPKRHPEDSWLNEMPGDHRAFIDSSRPMGGIESLQYASNILSAHTRVYGGDESDYAMIVCFRRFATPFGYGDTVWKKYGAVFNRIAEFPDPATGEAFTANPGNIPDRRDLPNVGNTIDLLGERGVYFVICDAATRVISGLLSRTVGGTAEDIYEELIDSAVPNSQFVPAGVLAATRSQEFGYSLLAAG